MQLPPLDSRKTGFSDPILFIFKWPPRLIVMSAAGFYSLGYAYEIGLMARIDREAIKILIPRVGYIGLGASMPVVQKYSAWTVRALSAVAAGIVYDITERIFCFVWKKYKNSATEKKRQVTDEITCLQKTSEQSEFSS